MYKYLKPSIRLKFKWLLLLHIQGIRFEISDQENSVSSLKNFEKLKKILKKPFQNLLTETI